MSITHNIGHHGIVAAGLAGLFGTAVVGAQLAATAVVYVGEWLIG